MKLFIGNPTNQTHIFTFRRPGDRVDNPSRSTIRPGAQIVIDDLDPEDMRDIIHQHRAFGFCTIRDALRNPTYRGLVYSEDRPVDFQALADGVQDNHEKLKAEGARNRRASAEQIAGQTIAKTKGRRNRTRSLDVEISTQSDSDKAPSAFSKETYHADGE
ncbi:hypothetical protein J3T99_05620 [Acetobacteraceae bacterium B3987]|nr:hypothetical protein [Acetobacteraceae bacterium B3987]